MTLHTVEAVGDNSQVLFYRSYLSRTYTIFTGTEGRLSDVIPRDQAVTE